MFRSAPVFTFISDTYHLWTGDPWLGRQLLLLYTHGLTTIQNPFLSLQPRVAQMECCYATAYAPYARTEVLPIEWSRFQYLLCNPIVQ